MRYSPVSPVSDPEKILKDAKAKQKWALSSRKSLKTQSKFISEDQVPKYGIKQSSSSTVLASEKKVLDLYIQSPINSKKTVTLFQVGVESLQNFSEYDGEIVLGSNDSKAHILSPSSQSINSEPSYFIEDKSEISSLVQVHSHSEVSTSTEEELQKVLEIAPFLDRTLLTEEDIAYILRTFENNPNYFMSLQSRQYPIDFSSNFTTGSSSFFFHSEGLFESISPQSEEVLDSGQSFEDLKNSVNSQSPVSSPKISVNFQPSGQLFLPLPPVVQIPTTSNPLIVHTIPVMAQPPTRMEMIVAARYAPLVLPQPLNPLPPGDYLR